MQLTPRDSDLLWKNISDFTMQSDSFSLYTFCLHELKHLSIIIPFFPFWCYNVVSHIKIWGCIFFRQPRPQLLTSRGSSLLSNHWLSWLYADMRSNLKSFLERSQCLLARFTVSRATRRGRKVAMLNWKLIPFFIFLLQMYDFFCLYIYPILPFSHDLGMTGLFMEATENIKLL